MSRRHDAAMAFCSALLAAMPSLAMAQISVASGQNAAPVDLTGYWVSLITDEWTSRMLTPPAGDYRSMPLNDAGRTQADRWDPAADEAAGEACKGYAAPALMRLPSRLHITWQDPMTLRVEVDTGTQTRLFHFDHNTPPGPRTWQGHSLAQWEIVRSAELSAETVAGALHVDTTNLQSGYLQKNGVPFSDSVFVTEFFNVLVGEDESEYLAVQIFVEDPTYLSDHWVKTVQFRREPDAEHWNPTPCSAY